MLALNAVRLFIDDRCNNIWFIYDLCNNIYCGKTLFKNKENKTKIIGRISELPHPYGLGFSFHQEILASLSGKYRYILLPSVSPMFHRESPFGQTSHTRKLYETFARSNPLSCEGGLPAGRVKYADSIKAEIRGQYYDYKNTRE